MAREISVRFTPDPDERQSLPKVSALFDPDVSDPFSLTQAQNTADGGPNDLIVMTIGQARDLAEWIMECIDGQ